VGKTLGKILSGLVIGLSTVENPWRRADTRLRVSEALLPHHRIATRHGPLIFVTAHPQALHYPREFATSEPETLAWIDSFEPPCRFWDVGANIGVFSTYAGLRAGIEVRAFEPAAASYASLCRNIEANGLGHRVQPYCIALSDRTELGRLNLSGTNAGSVFNAFESTVDYFGNEIAIVFAKVWSASRSTISAGYSGYRRPRTSARAASTGSLRGARPATASGTAIASRRLTRLSVLIAFSANTKHLKPCRCRRSLVITLALLEWGLGAAAAFAAAQLDKSFQIEAWGEDTEQAERRAALAAAAQFISLLSS